jgi:topoisomerase-4 subunit B
MSKNNNVYNESSIQVLEGLEAVRKRPGMYIGSTDARGLHHLVWEILDNAIDEAINGYGNKIAVTIESDDTIFIEDEGRGMPTGIHATGVSTLEVIFSVLHAGGKFSTSAGYKTSGGLHGVGASVVNALSSFLEVTVYYNHKISSMRFEKGWTKKSPLKELGNTNKTGSAVRFQFDNTIFYNAKFDADMIAQRLRESAYLLDEVTFTLVDKRTNKEEVFAYENGLIKFCEDVTENKTVLHEPIIIKKMVNDIQVDVGLQWTSNYQEEIFSFVNLVRTKDGGAHEVGLKTALTKAMNDFARRNGLLKEKDKNFEGSDIREGLSAILAVRIPENILQFEGQTKGKLGTVEAKSAVENAVMESFLFALEENRYFSVELIKKIQKAVVAKEAARKARESARQGKNSGRNSRALAGKLSPAQQKNKKRNELYLVEGDSAGGSAKQGRDSKFQAILPLRGKVLNTEKAALADVLKNEELSSIIYTISAGVANEFTLEDCAYDKVIIMTDADTDGAHIQILLLTFFYRYMRPLLEAKKIYLAQPPLYKVYNNKQSVYCYDDDELIQAKKDIKNYSLQRYKGLGEMNADQLWDTTMNPETRQLLQVNIDDALMAQKKVTLLMGDKASARREWLDEHVSFSMIEKE